MSGRNLDLDVEFAQLDAADERCPLVMIEGQGRTIRVLRITNHDVILGDFHRDAATFVRQRRKFEAFFLEGIGALRVGIVHSGPPKITDIIVRW